MTCSVECRLRHYRAVNLKKEHGSRQTARNGTVYAETESQPQSSKMFVDDELTFKRWSLKSDRVVRTASVLYGLEHENEAAELYARTFGRNVYRVGLVINPSCAFLGCSPDRRVLDLDTTSSEWGLLEIKCTTHTSVTECDYLQKPRGNGGKLALKITHSYYYQVMAQMGLTGSSWCDFFVYATSDYHLERINFDEQFFNDMMTKVTNFYFSHYLQC